jgi:hypothetical protein
LMTMDELASKLRALGSTKATAEGHLAQAREGGNRIEELRTAKRAMLAAYASGILYDGIYYFSPELRREIYEALRLKITVGHGSLKFDANVDAEVIRLTREVEEYAGEIERYRDKVRISRKKTDKVMVEVAG